MWPVSSKLNSPKNDSPDLLEPIQEPDAPTGDDVPLANQGGAGARADELRVTTAGRVLRGFPQPYLGLD